ncbi:hypothetical protein Bbelb_344920 [Branchiostoma belcheri]|nr:hypothetical protein Bbelb_344920 [Branchiostoma belcheri]
MVGEEKRARFVEWSCDEFLNVFMNFAVSSRLPKLYEEAGLLQDEARKRQVDCHRKVTNSLWHWTQQDKRVNLDNITILKERPELRSQAKKQRFVCPHPLPPATILLNEISNLGLPDSTILEFFRDFNRQLIQCNHNRKWPKYKYSGFLSVTLCCVEERRGNKVIKKTWGGSVPLPKHLREIYIKYAARWFWHPIVSLPVLLSLDQTQEGKELSEIRVVPVNPPNLSCRAFQLQFHLFPELKLPVVKQVPPCSQCKDMFPSHDNDAGYVQYKATPLEGTGNKWCLGNCAEVTAFSEMFYQLGQKCHVENADGKKILTKYKMEKMRRRAKFVK